MDNLDEGGRKNANYYYWAFGGLLVLVAIAYWTRFENQLKNKPCARGKKKEAGRMNRGLHRKERNALEAQRKEMNALELNGRNNALSSTEKN